MLPSDEIDYIQQHPQPSSRLKALFEAGWSLSSIGSSLNPPVAKSTLYYQIRTATEADISRPVPSIPEKKLSIRPISPQVPKSTAEELARLAKLARNCRAKTTASSPFRVANEKLTRIAVELYQSGVPVNSIAKAAKVSPRAMYRRVSKGLAR